MRARVGTMALAAVLAAGCEPVNGSDGGVDAGRIVAVASMAANRGAGVAFALPGDRVLVAGGVEDFARWQQHDGGGATTSEVFDLGTRAWSTAPGLSVPRYRPASVMLSGGRPLVLGGVASDLADATDVVEVYALDAGTWSVQGHLASPREYFAATLLGSGQVLVVGGHPDDAADAGVLATAELYDPATGGSIPTGSLHVARAGPAAARGTDDRVLVAGGATNGDWSSSTDTVEIYQPDAGTWTAAQPLPGRLVGAMATALAFGEVLVAGGCVDGASACGPEAHRAYRYDLRSGARTDLPDMPSAHVSGAAVLLPSGRVLVVSGDNPIQAAVPGSLYVPELNRWVPVGTTIRTGVFSAVACLPDGRVVVAGGAVWEAATSSLWMTDAAELYQP